MSPQGSWNEADVLLAETRTAHQRPSQSPKAHVTSLPQSDHTVLVPRGNRKHPTHWPHFTTKGRRPREMQSLAPSPTKKTPPLLRPSSYFTQGIY